MTDYKEKAEEYFCEHCENSFEHDNGHCSNCSKWDYFIAGLKESEKEITLLTSQNKILLKKNMELEFNAKQIRSLFRSNDELDKENKRLEEVVSLLENINKELKDDIKNFYEDNFLNMPFGFKMAFEMLIRKWEIKND